MLRSKSTQFRILASYKLRQLTGTGLHMDRESKEWMCAIASMLTLAASCVFLANSRRSGYDVAWLSLLLVSVILLITAAMLGHKKWLFLLLLYPVLIMWTAVANMTFGF